MNRIKMYLNGLGRGTRVLVLSLAVIFVSAGIAQATSTTIDTSVSTANVIASGTLSVTGLSSLGQATTTMLTAYSAYFGKSATTSIDTAGNLSVLGTLKVGTAGTQTTQIISGYCVATAAFALASTTGVYADCTPYTAAGVAITTLTAITDRVFVQATSSLPAWVVIQSASTTAGTKINVRMVNVSTTTPVASATYAFNFWAFQ